MRTSALRQARPDQQAWIAPGSLVTAAAASELFLRYPMYADALDWLQRFVTCPHPDLGRPGAVCPSLAPAMRADTVWLVAIITRGAAAEAAAEAGQLLTTLFEGLTEEAPRQTSAVLGLFPRLAPEDAGEFIDTGHRLLRPLVVPKGLMIGEFHPSSTVTSVHNPALPVMRCPVPMFAVRAMTPHDLLFLDRPHMPPAERLTYLSHFRDHVGHRLGPTARADLQARLAAVRAALRAGGPS